MHGKRITAGEMQKGEKGILVLIDRNSRTVLALCVDNVLQVVQEEFPS